MIAVDAEDHAGVFDAGIRLLNEKLGPDATRVFLNLTRGGTGDRTKEKYERPQWTDADHEAYMAKAKAEGIDPNTISRITGLTDDEIRRL